MKILNLEKSIAIEDLERHFSRDGQCYWSLAKNKSTGFLTSPECPAKLAWNIQGFEVFPKEKWIAIAPIAPANTPMRFASGLWVPASEPVFATAEELRASLTKWVGPIKFRVRLQRIPTNDIGVPEFLRGDSPIVSSIKIAFGVAASDRIDYCLNFALPDRFKQPVALHRVANVGSDGISLALPPNIAPSKISEARFLIPGKAPISATVGGSALSLSTPTVPGMRGVLMFSLVPSVELAGDVYQVTDVPSVALMPVGEKNRQSIPNPEWVKGSGGSEVSWESAYTYDLLVEVAVIGKENSDVRAIADRLAAIADDPQTAYLDLHPWGEKIGMSLAGGIDGGSKIKTLPGLRVESFRILIGGLSRGGRFSVQSS